MDLSVLRRAKKWRLDKLSKAELAGLISHHMKQDALSDANGHISHLQNLGNGSETIALRRAAGACMSRAGRR